MSLDRTRLPISGASADLFDCPIVPGISTAEEFIDESVEAALIGHIDAQALEPFRFQGWLGKRLTASFGWSYDFQNGSIDTADPIPEWLRLLKAKAASFAGLDDQELVQALLIRYDPGAGIGWHRDRPVFDHVVGISLGVPANLRFRRRRPVGFERASVPLPPRSVYHLAGEARHQWEHSIVEMDVTRWSITFRSFSEFGQRTLQS